MVLCKDFLLWCIDTDVAPFDTHFAPLQLQKLLDAAEKTIPNLKAKISELTATISSLTKELDAYRSIRGRLNQGKLKEENTELQQQNNSLKSVIEQHGLGHLLGRKKDQRQTRDMR